MADPERIRDVLRQYPEVTTIEDAIDCCKGEGLEVDSWAVYFAARDIGRRLVRRPPEAFGEADVRDLALIFLRLHEGKKAALATLDKLQEMNDGGTRIAWQSENTSTACGWELSVAQELADLAGGIPEARQIVSRL